jgi:hypothetical protein
MTCIRTLVVYLSKAFSGQSQMPTADLLTRGNHEWLEDGVHHLQTVSIRYMCVVGILFSLHPLLIEHEARN